MKMHSTLRSENDAFLTIRPSAKYTCSRTDRTWDNPLPNIFQMESLRVTCCNKEIQYYRCIADTNNGGLRSEKLYLHWCTCVVTEVGNLNDLHTINHFINVFGELEDKTILPAKFLGEQTPDFKYIVDLLE